MNNKNRMMEKGIVGLILVGCLLFAVSCKKTCTCTLVTRDAATDEVNLTLYRLPIQHQSQESGRACKNREKELNNSNDPYLVSDEPNYYSVYECKTE
jgi:hypothetical protein